MAARVLLFGILFTEVVLEPVCAAGGKGADNNLNGHKNGSKRDGLNFNLNKSTSQNLRIEPGGLIVLGKKGVTLNCLPGNNHDVSWLYNGESAPPCGVARCGILDNGSLHFYKKQNLQLAQKSSGRNETIDMSKKHEYRCIGRTVSGGFLRSSPVFIQIADLSYTFKKSPINVTVHEGEITRLSCLIDSLPYPPNITWQHDGKPLLSDRNNTKYIMVPPGVLYITATKQSDTGLYRCIATNDFIKKTKKSREAKLTVIPKLKLQELNIPVSLFPQTFYNYTLVKGSNLSLVCAVSGNPLLFLKWSLVPHRSDGANSAQSRILFNSTTGISVLELKNVSIFHAGTYLCSLENAASGVMEIQNITVDVTVPPTFIKKPSNQNCPNGKTARFECQAEGVPTPKIYWLKDAKNITINGGRKTIYIKENNKVELAISATVPSDSGDYQCVAVNSAGEIWAAGRLQVNASHNSPAAPTKLTCHTPSPVKISISWTPPESLPPSSITAYTVHYSPEGGGKEEVSPEPGNSTTVEVTKLLEPYTNYSFYVRVWNNNGASDQSATIVCATAPSVPKTAPKVMVDVLSSTKLNITWQPLTKKEARGVVIEYKIQWRLHEHPSYRVIFVSANVEHHLLTNLLPGAQYDLRVLARTEKGWPNISESLLGWNTVVMPTIDTDNYNIRNVLDVEIINMNASHLKMKWQVKEATFDTFKFDSWQIYCESVNGDKLFTALLDKNSTEYMFTNLEPNISYTVGLCIVTKGVSSDCILKIIKSIQYDSGNTPVALEANPLSPSSIQLTWAVVNKTSVDKYEVCYELVQYPDSNFSKCIFVNDTKAIIGELEAFTLYRFKVRSLQKDLNNSSQFSESIECYTSEDVPGKPEEVQVFQNGTKIRVVWKEPSKTNGIILTYFISYYSSDLVNSTLTWGNMTVPGNKTSVVLPDLPLGGRYYIMVQAATKAGYGRRSDPIYIFLGVSMSKTSTSSDKQKPPAKSKPDQSLGIILGVGISICFIMISLCSIYCRKKWEHSRSLRESAQPFKNRIFSRNSTTCCVEQSSTSVSQQVNNRIGCNEIELAVLCPSSPTSVNPQLDSKGVLSNGVEIGAKEPLLTSWNSNEENRDLHITENIQYKQSNSPVLKNQLGSEQDLNITELTTIDCTLNSSTNSLNNNLGCPTSSPKKITPPVIPVLEPNG